MTTTTGGGRVRRRAIWVVVVAAASVVLAAQHPLPDELIGSSEEDGRQMLIDCLEQGQDAFLKLFEHWDSQQTPTYCGVAAAVDVLNALGAVPAPPDTVFSDEMRYFTQTNLLLMPNMSDVVPIEVIRQQGLTLKELSEIIDIAGNGLLNVRPYYSTESVVDVFRREVNRTMNTPNSYVIVNFDRKAINELGAGHHSPIGAYHSETDRVLVLDVAKQRYPPVWVDLVELYESTCDCDGEPHGRGFLTVEYSDCDLHPNV